MPLLVKNRAHFFRMNPQTLRREKVLLTPALIATLLFASALIALYWLGSIDSPR